MDPMSYDDLLENVIQRDLVDNVVVPKVEKLFQYFTKNTNVEKGNLISDRNALTETTAGGAFSRGEAFPASLAKTWATATWTKVYYQESATVRGETISEAGGNFDAIGNILSDAASSATRQLMDKHVYSGCMTQLKSDVDSDNTYGSYSALTRGTETTAYEENTDATITLAYMRAMYKALVLKEETNWEEYITLIEPTVWSTFWPLADALVSKYRMNPMTGESTATGYMDVHSFDGVPVTSMYGMTTGDVMCLNRNDVQIQQHLPLQLVYQGPKELGAFEHKITAITGINAWCRRPSRNGKMTLKD